MGRTRRLVTVAIASAAVALTLAACGSSGSDNTDSSGTTSAGAATSAASTNPGLAEAQAAVAALMKRPTTMEVPPLPKKPEAGKTLDFVVCVTPTCKAFVPYLKQATDAVGWKLNAVQGGFAPQEIQNAWNKVLRDNPDGVIASGGIPAALFANQLKVLRQRNVPVVLHDQLPEKDPAVTSVVLSSKENYQFGKELGQAIVADSKGKDAHVAMFVTPQVPVFANEGKALKSIINSSACQGCTTGVQEFPVSDAGTKLPSKVVSYVRAHPETNYVYFDFNDAVDGVPAALQRAGLASKVKLLSNNIATTEAQYVRNGQMWAAAANPWPETLWKDFHIVLAKAQNAPMGPPKGVELPNMIVTKDNLPPLNGGMFPLVVNYQDAFKKAWHVQ